MLGLRRAACLILSFHVMTNPISSSVGGEGLLSCMQMTVIWKRGRHVLVVLDRRHQRPQGWSGLLTSSLIRPAPWFLLSVRSSMVASRGSVRLGYLQYNSTLSSQHKAQLRFCSSCEAAGFARSRENCETTRESRLWRRDRLAHRFLRSCGNCTAGAADRRSLEKHSKWSRSAAKRSAGRTSCI